MGTRQSMMKSLFWQVFPSFRCGVLSPKKMAVCTVANSTLTLGRSFSEWRTSETRVRQVRLCFETEEFSNQVRLCFETDELCIVRPEVDQDLIAMQNIKPIAHRHAQDGNMWRIQVTGINQVVHFPISATFRITASSADHQHIFRVRRVGSVRRVGRAAERQIANMI